MVASSDLETRVPSTPKWAVRDLAHHIGTVQWYWSENVRAKNPDERSGGSLTALPPDSDLVAWLGWCTYGLFRALRDAGPDAPCWAWWPDPTPHTAGAVARHQAQEAAVHRWDAEGSAGLASPLPPELATDGVPEFIEVMVGTDVEGPTGRRHAHRHRYGRDLAGRLERVGSRSAAHAHGRAACDRVGPGAHALPAAARSRRRRRR